MKWYIYVIIGLGVLSLVYFIYSMTSTPSDKVSTKPKTNIQTGSSSMTALQWVTALSPILIGAAAIGSQTNWFGLNTPSDGN